jgi:hypothetical protein
LEDEEIELPIVLDLDNPFEDNGVQLVGIDRSGNVKLSVGVLLLVHLWVPCSVRDALVLRHGANFSLLAVSERQLLELGLHSLVSRVTQVKVRGNQLPCLPQV